MKQFLIVGSIGAVTYANVFPYIKSREVHYRPEYYGIKEYDNTDVKVTATWYTTLIPPYIPPLVLTKTYNPDENIKYDNYDAIEVSKTMDIPYDYQGVMGVPTTFLDKWNSEQFEIVGWSRHNDMNMDGGYWFGGKADATINGNEVYRRILIRHRK